MKSSYRFILAHRWAAHYLNIALVAAVFIQIGLYVSQSGDDYVFNSGPGIEKNLYLASLLLLIGVIISRYIYHTKQIRRSEAGREQLDAMLSMFSGVKHKLNNDMQVVLGNAELAEILVKAGGDAYKPVQNITAAANQAVERIEQLSVFGSTGRPNLTSVDLNAMFRQCMAKMAEELPPIVTLRLELEPLCDRVVVDRYLLSLSLSHLIRVSASSMRHGGEVVIRTSDNYDRCDGVGGTVIARVYIVRALSYSEDSEHRHEWADDSDEMSKADIDICQNGLLTIKALVERSGVKSVELTRAGDESLFTMRLATDMQSETDKNQLQLSRNFTL